MNFAINISNLTFENALAARDLIREYSSEYGLGISAEMDGSSNLERYWVIAKPQSEGKCGIVEIITVATLVSRLVNQSFAFPICTEASASTAIVFPNMPAILVDGNKIAARIMQWHFKGQDDAIEEIIDKFCLSVIHVKGELDDHRED